MITRWKYINVHLTTALSYTQSPSTQQQGWDEGEVRVPFYKLKISVVGNYVHIADTSR